MWGEAAVVALATLATRMLEMIILVIKDQPEEERRKAWQRWFNFWDKVLWKPLGLDAGLDPLGGGSDITKHNP